MSGPSTLLTITGNGIAPFSARGLTQVLDHIDQASNTKRTVNGALKNIGFDGFKKLKTTITCNDVEAPAFDGVWPGDTITVHCSAEQSYLTSLAGANHPAHAVVADSSRVEGDYTYYRPVLDMMVVNFTASHDEWGGMVSWSLQAEEI